MPPGSLPWLIAGTIKIVDPTTITIPGGVEIRGGTIDLGRSGHLIAVGENGKPVIFRHVKFLQDLSGSFKADGEVFDDCEFRKAGPWFNGYSSKWIFSSCVLFNCRFGDLDETNYGFQFRNCDFISTDLPEIKHPHKAGFSHVTALHHDWNKIVGGTFIDCAVPPTVAWCAESSTSSTASLSPASRLSRRNPGSR